MPPQSLPLLAILVLLGSGCVTSTTTTRDIALDEPRASDGVVLEDSPAEWTEQWAKALDAQEQRGKPQTPPSDEKASPADQPIAGPDESEWPADSGQLIDLPRLGRIELAELLEVLTLRLKAEEGYTAAPEDLLKKTPELPAGVAEDLVLSRMVDGEQRVLRLGYWLYKAHRPQFALYGATVLEDSLGPNPDLDGIESAVQHVLSSFQAAREDLSPQDLEGRIVQLSYIDTASALSGLKGLGFSTIAADTAVPDPAVFDKLPYVIELPAPKVENTGLVGKSATGQSALGSTIVPTAGDFASEMIASPTRRLMVLHHPAHPEQFGRVKKVLDDVLDRPARQVFVEGLIIEIDEIGLDELGIQWEFRKRKWNFTLGTEVADLLNPLDSLTGIGQKSDDFSTDWVTRIRALVQEGKAEILSRPSVLTLNDRQATIRIGTDIPIATSQEGISADSNKISFDFKYLPLGILLNVRPRVSSDSREISLMVDTVVSDRIPGTDLEIRDENGSLLASAPLVQSRRVQTYARIQNNTPFIIGGLVARERIEAEDKVPILGDIPLLGRLFRSTTVREGRQEVIIILTPYVLPEELHLSRALPDSDLVNSEKNELFRDTYRLGPEDILDISFLYRNQRFKTYQRLAKAAIETDFELAETEPFRSFSENRLPGGQIIVGKIIANAVERLGLVDRVPLDRITVPTSYTDSGYEAKFMDRLIARRGDGEDYESFFTKNPGKALTLTFFNPLEALDSEALTNDPVPRIEIVDCPDRDAWKRLLWDLNQPDPATGSARHTIVLNGEEDLVPLRMAVLVKSILNLNGGGREASIFNFIPGRVVQVPDQSSERVFLLGADIARNFFHIHHPYSAAVKKIEQALRALDTALRLPEFRYLLDGEKLPPMDKDGE